ncbi:hypothetical protein BAUCODRAFT_38289 [Baudoinia panamericana UAMH 10762]|uniref:SHSP domain-containing protein n=1 Tax=Baudoinia panamericana (strain UAMH 10762) TaxID=717646 RepID=M2LE54_BAUPA|nr:uncharacterized protein BAUCODRAFT_38289 [Baudoinia panamericana UAMH 10762]EMC92257.1 hypothetical protein BAUCODRAFT_38289 [Baudoinia panamericana UAMH 10762]
MPSVRYYNQTAPFWDFIASMEEQGASHPFFAGMNNNNHNRQTDESDNEPQPNPWTDGWAAGFPFGGPFAHRGRHGPPRHPNGPPPHHGPHHHPNGPPGPPPPPAAEHDMPDPPEQVPEDGPSDARGPPPPFEEEPPHHGPGHHGRHGPGHRGRGGMRGRGGFGGRGRCGGRGPFGHPAFGGPGGFGALAEMFQSQLFGEHNENSRAADDNKDDASFRPEVDVFDTTSSFVVHVSLPGAKKEDVGVNYDVEKSELSIAGVVYRPADEELLNALAMDERKVGVFERKVRLGSRASPAQVDVEGISAKLEEGVLKIDVPKLSAEDGFVEVRKVDIE